MSILDDFARVNSTRRCPTCGRPDWCLVSKDNPADPSCVVCARIESKVRFGEAGWLHTLRHDRRSAASARTRFIKFRAVRHHEFERLHSEYRSSIRGDVLTSFGCSLGVSVESLRRLGIGFLDRDAAERIDFHFSHAWAFPMRSARGETTGIRLRLPHGEKFCIKGSTNGLFVPHGLPTEIPELVIGEGESDTAALLDLEFHAIGRPGCRACASLLASYVEARHPQAIVVASDSDDRGRSGAQDLARSLRLRCREVRVVTPPEGIKDAREWKRRGATHGDIVRAIEIAKPISLSVSLGRC